MRDKERKKGNALTEIARTEHSGEKRSKKKKLVITKRADTETRQASYLPCFTLCTRIYAQSL